MNPNVTDRCVWVWVCMCVCAPAAALCSATERQSTGSVLQGWHHQSGMVSALSVSGCSSSLVSRDGRRHYFWLHRCSHHTCFHNLCMLRMIEGIKGNEVLFKGASRRPWCFVSEEVAAFLSRFQPWTVRAACVDVWVCLHNDPLPHMHSMQHLPCWKMSQLLSITGTATLYHIGVWDSEGRGGRGRADSSFLPCTLPPHTHLKPARHSAAFSGRRAARCCRW